MLDMIEEMARAKQVPPGFAEIVDRHFRAEIEQDLDAIMATVCPEPDYTFEPLDWVIRDHDLLREFYAEAMSVMTRLEPKGARPAMFSNDDALIMWDRSMLHRNVDGTTTPLNMVAIVLRDPATGLIKGEHTFLDRASAEVFRAMVSPAMQARLSEERRK